VCERLAVLIVDEVLILAFESAIVRMLILNLPFCVTPHQFIFVALFVHLDSKLGTELAKKTMII